MNDANLNITLIYPNPDQPRKEFDTDKLEELAMSIKQYGILEPIVVTPRGDRFMIISGERRYRASLLAGLTEIPARVIEADDALVEELALLENIQRQDLNPIEVARAFKALLDRGWTKEDLANKMGFKQTWRVDEKLALLGLTPELQGLVVGGTIGGIQAQWICRVDPQKQIMIAKKLVAGELNTINKLRSFVEGLILAEKQETIFTFQSLTADEQKAISDFSGLIKSVERLIKATDGSVDNLKKAAFHSDVTIERIDLIIQHLQKLRKTIRAGAGLKDAIAA